MTMTTTTSRARGSRGVDVLTRGVLIGVLAWM